VGGVATKAIPNNCAAAGNPAKLLKKNVTTEQTEPWKMPDKLITKAEDYITDFSRFRDTEEE